MASSTVVEKLVDYEARPIAEMHPAFFPCDDESRIEMTLEHVQDKASSSWGKNFASQVLCFSVCAQYTK